MSCPTCGSDEPGRLLDPCVRMQEYQWVDGFGDGPDPYHTKDKA